MKPHYEMYETFDIKMLCNEAVERNYRGQANTIAPMIS